MPSRARLNRDAVVVAAQAMVDEQGWQQLTMTALSKALGVQVPSLYNHVGSFDDLLGEVQVRAHADLAQRMQRAAMGRVGPAAFRGIATAFLDFATEHPGLYDLAISEPMDPPRVREASEPSGAALAAVVTSFGVEDLTAELAMACVATLHGVISLSRAQLFGDSVDTSAVYERAIRLVTQMLEDESAS